MTGALQPIDLRTEGVRDALGLGTAMPRLSWRVADAPDDWQQVSHEIEVADADTRRPIWRSGRVASSESTLVPWGGPALAARQRCHWRVRVHGVPDASARWSEWAPFEVGLLRPDDWAARFVTPDWEDGPDRPGPCPYLRVAFRVDAPVGSARLWATALGCYEMELNGSRVGDDVLAPGWTSYAHRLPYQTYDVTDLVRPGENVLGAILADGWARGHLGWDKTRNLYTDCLALLAQLEVRCRDGSVTTVGTGDDWRASVGPVLSSDLYDGEHHDARHEHDGWSTPGFDDRAWSPVRVVERGLDTVLAAASPPVRRQRELAPVTITTAPSGETIVDFGQNVAGRARIRVQGTAGTMVTLRHAETLEGGELCTRLLRRAEATDRYVLRGRERPEIWEPRFTYHGFRYLGVSGWPGTLRPEDVTAVVCHSDLERTGWFGCSDPDVERLHDNIVWGMRGNFVSVPTDCPQRDERFGWCGDLQVFAPTAMLLHDIHGFLTSWLEDLAADQRPDGAVPSWIPHCPGYFDQVAAGWGDAAVIVPWLLAHHTGDLGLLRRCYPSMRAWVDYVDGRAGPDHVWTGDFQLGDWLDPAAPPDEPGSGRTDPSLVATAYFARSTALLAAAAGLLDRRDDAVIYGRLADEVAAAFRAEWVTPNGRLACRSLTACALALGFDLVEPHQRRRVVELLAELVREEDYRPAAGFHGAALLCEVLSREGHDDEAYRLLLQHDCPSWLYQVDTGATTMWERWDSIRPDGSVNPGAMTSLNHYAFGAVGAWLYRWVAGLRPDPDRFAWRRFVVGPRPGGGLTRAAATLDVASGRIESAWHIDGDRFVLDVTVPPNTRAAVEIPGTSPETLEVGSGRHHWETPLDAETLARWLPTPEHARFSLASPLGEVLATPQAVGVLLEHRLWDVLDLDVGRWGAQPLRAALDALHDAPSDRDLRRVEDDLVRC